MSLVQVIKWETNQNELVHKFQTEDIRLGSQLIVYPGQTAFFVKGGVIYDEFLEGTYTIQTDNIPLLGKIINQPFGGDSPFQAEIWFVNQLEFLNNKWGTQAPLNVEDPTYGVIVPIRAFGQFGFKIFNPRTFLERLSGNMSSFSIKDTVEYFRGMMLSKMTSIIYNKMKESGISVLNINSYIDEISSFAKCVIAEVFEEYGIDIELFNIISFSVSDSDVSFQRLKETKDAAARIKIMGNDDYRLARSFDVLEKAAENESGMAGAAVGLGAGVGIGGAVGSLVAQNINSAPPLQTVGYYLGIGGAKQGPFSLSQVESKILTNEISENTLVWKRGLPQWVPIRDLDDFSGILPPPLP